MQHIRVRGARTHNLKNLNLDLPRERLIVVMGLSGSGKSSLTFDTLYAEGQRRYVESLSAYARQFLSTMDKPDVDSIEGLSPAIAIEQKAGSHNPRSTVGTVTEIYDYLRLLYARAGTPRCPDHGIDLAAQTVSQMVDQVLRLPEGLAAALLAPVVSERKGEQLELLEDLAAQGFVRVRIDGRIHEMDALPQLDGKKKHTIEAVVDRVRIRPDAAQRLAESFETALRLSGGLARLAFLESGARGELVFSRRHACPGVGLQRPAARAEAVLVQQPVRRLPELRWAWGAGILRSAAGGVAPASVTGRRRGAWLGPAQRSLLQPDPVARAPLRLRHRDALDGAAGARAPCAAARQRRGGDRIQLPRGSGTQIAQASRVRRDPAEPDAALSRDRVTDGARGAGALPGAASVPGVPGHAPEPRGAFRVRRRTHSAGARASHGRAGARVPRPAQPRRLAR